MGLWTVYAGFRRLRSLGIWWHKESGHDGNELLKSSRTSFEQKITNIAPMNKSDIVNAPKNSWASPLSLKITRVRDSPTSSREFPRWTSAGSTLRNRDLQPSLGSCRSPHPVALSNAVTTWHARSFKIILHVKCETKSYWQVFNKFPSFSRSSWLGCRCAHATASTKRMCQEPASHSNEVIFGHSWPWSESKLHNPPGLAAEVSSSSSHFSSFQHHSTPGRSNCGHIATFRSFNFVTLSLWVQGPSLMTLKTTNSKGRGRKMNQRRARNLYQITQMTFFKAICRTPWNMVDPSSAPQ